MEHGMSPRRMALMATIHCLTGCAIGEVAGMMLGAHFGWNETLTITVAVTLAFLTGYALSTLPLVRRGFSVLNALKLVLAADTLSILTMEIVDNAIMLSIPGAMHAPLWSWSFWIPMTIALLVAGLVAYPVNAYLLSKGKGHALTHHASPDHDHHHGHHHHDEQVASPAHGNH